MANGFRRTAAKTPRRHPESLRLSALTPAFTVNDLEKSITWYRDVLGFHVADRWQEEGKVTGVQLLAGTVNLMLTQDDFVRGRDRIKGVGMHLHCSTRQNVDQIAADIKERGGVLEREPTDQPWGTRDFALVDPDGFRITVSSI